MFLPGRNNNQDPDAALVPIFKTLAQRCDDATRKAGRPIYEDIEVVELRAAGTKDYGVYPAHAFSDWVTDPFTGQQNKRTYAERFQRQYRQFKEQQTQTKQGTPLDMLPFVTKSRVAELKALNIYTAEAMLSIDGAELKNLGPGGRELKNQIAEYIEGAKYRAPDMQLQAEVEALRAKASMLEEDNARLQSRREPGEGPRDPMLDDMSNDGLKEYITSQTGTAPIGNNLNRRTLLRMAADAKPKVNA